MKANKWFWGLLALCAVNFAAHLCLYPALPDTVPIHWNAAGQANGWGPKWMMLVLAALPAGLLVLMRLVCRMDPKHFNYGKFEGIWNGFCAGTVLFMAAIGWLCELTVRSIVPNGSTFPVSLLFGGIGVLLVLFGNYLPRVRQNYTFGCKTPWALNDEHNWDRTNRMGGIVFVCIGAALLISAPFLGMLERMLGSGGVAALIAVPVLGGSLWIYLYSYLVSIGKLK